MFAGSIKWPKINECRFNDAIVIECNLVVWKEHYKTSLRHTVVQNEQEKRPSVLSTVR